jgi:hypothetical protein
MCTLTTKRFLTGLFLALALGANARAQSAGGRAPDAGEPATLRAQAGQLISLEVVARAEQRAEELRAKLFDLQMEEMYLLDQLDDLEYRMRPDNLQRALAFVGSTRPMDELRDALRLRLENEKARANKQLEFLASSRERLTAALARADQEVERLRERLGPQ